MSTPAPGRFSSCDPIAELYKSYDVPSQKTEGLFGGKFYTWHVQKNGTPYVVTCQCNVKTLGVAILLIQSKMAGYTRDGVAFKGVPKVEKNGRVTASFIEKSQVQLPLPDGVLKELRSSWKPKEL